jgi:ubiquitin C-terminal hydrolase
MERASASFKSRPQSPSVAHQEEEEDCDDAHEMSIPDGISNLGNTCYAGCAIQLFNKLCQICGVKRESISP